MRQPTLLLRLLPLSRDDGGRMGTVRAVPRVTGQKSPALARADPGTPQLWQLRDACSASMRAIVGACGHPHGPGTVLTHETRTQIVLHARRIAWIAEQAIGLALLAGDRLDPNLLVSTVPTPIAPASLAATRSGRRRLWLVRLRWTVQAHLHDRAFGVQQLAERMHMSRTQLFRRVRDATGLSPQAYVTEARLCKAACLLEQGANSITDIVGAVGYATLAHFSRSFRRRFGVPPSQYPPKSGAGP